MKSSETAIPFLLLLFSITPFTEISPVYCSSVSQRIAKRPDPLRKFKHYGGDYDITNKHYWASAAFTGIHGYAVAVIWLISGIGFAVFIAAKYLSGSTSPVVNDHPNSSNLIILLLIILFTIFAITASSVAIAANQKSMQRAEKLEETIFGAGNDAFQAIGKIKTTLRRIHTFLLPYDSKTCSLLDFISHRLRRESLNAQSFVEKTRKSCDRALKTLYVANLVVVSINLVVLVFGLVLITSLYRPGILVLIFSCWILTTLSWILTGVDFFFYTFIGDTCSTLKNFEEDPENSSITEMLPCPKSKDTGAILEQIDYNVHNFIAVINSNIRGVFEMNELNDENQSVPEVCDPFSSSPDYSYSPQNCGKNSIQVGDLPGVLSRFICYDVNTSGNCVADGRFIPEAMYPISLAYSQSIKEFVKIYPDLSTLMKCSTVKQALLDIVRRQCRPIKVSTQMLWSSMLTLSLVMVVLVLLWSDNFIEDRGRCLSRWSIFHKPVHGS